MFCCLADLSQINRLWEDLRDSGARGHISTLGSVTLRIRFTRSRINSSTISHFESSTKLPMNQPNKISLWMTLCVLTTKRCKHYLLVQPINMPPSVPNVALTVVSIGVTLDFNVTNITPIFPDSYSVLR